MADRKLSGDAVDEIETDGENDVDSGENDDLVVVCADPIRQLRLKSGENEDRNNPERNPLLHTFSTVPLPMIPAGLNRRIRTSTMKAIASR